MFKRLVFLMALLFLVAGQAIAGTVDLPQTGQTNTFTQWAKTYGGQNSDGASSIKQTSDGGYIVAGTAGSFSTGNDFMGPDEVWVLKFDANGDIQWQKVYKNAEWEGYSVTAVEVTNDGGYILAGNAMTCYEDEGLLCLGYGWLLKIDANGEILWQKGYKDTGVYWGNGFSAVQQTKDGGYIAVGLGGEGGWTTGHPKLWVVKVDNNGNVEWQRIFDYVVVIDSVPTSIADSYANSVQQTKDGGYIVAGTIFIYTETGYYDIWVLKLDSNGDMEWHKIYRRDSVADVAYSIRQTSDDGYIVAGQTASSTVYGVAGLLLKLDKDGYIEWQKNYENTGGQLIQIVNQTDDGGYVVGGLYQQEGGVVVKLN